MSYLKYLLFLSIFAHLQADEITQHELEITDIAKEFDLRLLLFSTLNGYLYGIEQETGNIRWKIKDKAIIKVPKDGSIIPIFLPDPRDGSLYLIGTGNERLKKLPFTIQELVTSSPCRSSDGILYTGKKKDTWFLLDPHTGNRQHILGWDSSQGATCPVHTPDAIFVGRTEYSLMMVDGKQANRKWNVTYNDYSSARIDKELLANYDLVHFSSSSSGLLYTLDRRRAKILWEKHLDSPIVAVYILDADGLISVPFTSLSNQTLNNFALNLMDDEMNQQNLLRLYPTLYVGEYAEGLYALPSFVDKNLIAIRKSDGGPLLLEGPDGLNIAYSSIEFPVPGFDYFMPDGDDPLTTFQSIPSSSVIYLGHYEVPMYSKTKLQITGNSHTLTHLLTDESDAVRRETRGMQTEPILITRRSFMVNMMIVTGTVFLSMLFLYVFYNNSNRLGYFFMVGKKVVTDDGVVKIGKIAFNPDELLGKGCDGTFVYRGNFEGRRVAVKRLLPECFNFAEREVDLLRESDAHPNVVRYFCTEQDRMFKYIALELGQATLCDYVYDNATQTTFQIERIEVLKQATSGLAHLHSLNIVHRDIKPQNVLLSMAGPDGSVRAMISDFGLSKKLQLGKVSFSRRSGVTGTDGWIAPEMLKQIGSTTCAVDMFSLGCLYYYVLSSGDHPFGDTLHRQANILAGESTLSEIKDSKWRIELYKPLLQTLIAQSPNERPSCNIVLKYPIFWNNTTILTFLQDVSDRVEKSDMSDVVLQKLEENAYIVVRGDWRLHIDDELAVELRKYRSYRGESLRDLLRALRNKKHHFHELTQTSRDCLGEIPDKFTAYWMQRFPLLLIHTYMQMQMLRDEDTFKQYYTTNFSYKSDLLIDYQSHDNENVRLLHQNAIQMGQEEHAMKVQKKLNKTMKYTKRKHEQVGLYRNLAPDTVDLNDIHVNVTNSLTKRGQKVKNRRADDVPLMWMVPQSENGEIS